jgi:hypothetical protein
LSKTDKKNINWYDQLRQALRLATELESREDITRVTNAMFYCAEWDYENDAADRLLDDILRKIAWMTAEEYLRAYPNHGPYWDGLNLWYVLGYLKRKNSWKESHNRFTVKRILNLFRKAYHGKYDKGDIRRAKFKILFPKTNMILDTPGFILEICVVLMTLGQVSTGWTYSRWKAWTVSVLIVAGFWYW